MLREPFNQDKDNNIFVGSSFPFPPLVQVNDLLGQPIAALTLQARVEKLEASGWMQSRQALLREDWSAMSNLTGRLVFSAYMGVDWVVYETESTSLFRLSYCIVADGDALLCIPGRSTFSVIPGQVRFLDNPEPLVAVGSLLQVDVMVKVQVQIVQTSSTRGVDKWRAPFLQFALMADGENSKETCFLEGDQNAQSQVDTPSALSLSSIFHMKGMKLISCFAGSYRVQARAFSDVYSSRQNMFPSLSADRSANIKVDGSFTIDNSSLPQNISALLSASSQALFAIKVIQQPSTRVATFRPFVVSAKLYGVGSAIINNFIMTCSIDENPIFPDATYAALDPGG